MTHGTEIYRIYRGMVTPKTLQVLTLSVISSMFYQSLKWKKWMCELCSFSQIQSHTYLDIIMYTLNNYVKQLYAYIHNN